MLEERRLMMTTREYDISLEILDFSQGHCSVQIASMTVANLIYRNDARSARFDEVCLVVGMRFLFWPPFKIAWRSFAMPLSTHGSKC
jgi:hypothetical protein